MSMRIVRVIIRASVLLGLAGIMAVNASAGSGPVPDPNGPGIMAVNASAGVDTVPDPYSPGAGSVQQMWQ